MRGFHSSARAKHRSPALKTILYTGFEEGVPSWWPTDPNQNFIDTTHATEGTNSLRLISPAHFYGMWPGVSPQPGFDPVPEAYLSFSIRVSTVLPDGMDFSWGNTKPYVTGKFGGLCGTPAAVGGNKPNGTNGFSARFSWYDGGINVYIYHMDQPGDYGESWPVLTRGRLSISDGEWYRLTMRVKVNTGNNHDGEVQTWVNGAHGNLITGLQFVNNGDLVRRALFYTYHGGDDPESGPSHDCYSWWDDVRVYTRGSTEDLSERWTYSQDWESVVGTHGDPLEEEDGNPEIPYFYQATVPDRGCIIDNIEKRAGSYCIRQHSQSDFAGENEFNASFTNIYRQEILTESREMWAGAWLYYPATHDFAPWTQASRLLSLYPFGDKAGIHFATNNIGADTEMRLTDFPGGDLTYYFPQGAQFPSNSDWYLTPYIQGQWVWVELYINASSDSGEGIIRLWANDELLWDITRVTYGTGSGTNAYGPSGSAAIALLTNEEQDGPVGGQDAYTDECIIISDGSVVKAVDSFGNPMIGSSYWGA